MKFDSITKQLKGLKIETVVYAVLIIFLLVYFGNKIFALIDKNRRLKALEGKTDILEIRDSAAIKNKAQWFLDFFQGSWWDRQVNRFKENTLADQYDFIVSQYTDPELILLNETFVAGGNGKRLYQEAFDFEMSFFNEDSKDNFLGRLERLGLV